MRYTPPTGTPAVAAAASSAASVRPDSFGALEVVNLFAYRTAYPRELKEAGWPVGPENDHHIASAAREASAACLAWGAEASRTRRPAEVLQLLRDVGVQPQYLRLTKTGHPEHPLYLPGELRLKPFTIQAIDDAMHGSAV